MAKEPIWKGDLKHCPYCRDAVFPHGHKPEDEGDSKKRALRDAVAPKKRGRRAKASNDTPKVSTGRRGRPMKPETIELLSVCQGHGT